MSRSLMRFLELRCGKPNTKYVISYCQTIRKDSGRVNFSGRHNGGIASEECRC